MFVKESKNNVTAMNIITQAFKMLKISFKTYLVYRLKSPNQKSFEIKGSSFLKSYIEGWKLTNFLIVNVLV